MVDIWAHEDLLIPYKVFFWILWYIIYQGDKTNLISNRIISYLNHYLYYIAMNADFNSSKIESQT